MDAEQKKFHARFRKFLPDPHSNVRASDLGEQWGPGFFVKELGRIDDPDEPTAPPVEADPVTRRRPKTTSEREELVGQLADRLMDYYLRTYNDPTVLVNPFRDGLPNCVKHRFPPGCWHGCTEGVLPTVRHATKGQVYDWIKRWIASRAEFLNTKRSRKGYKTDLSGQVRVHHQVR